MVFAIRKYMQLLHDYPGAVGGTLASISILTSHAQMMSVVSRMKLSWPGKVKEAQSALNVFNLNLPAVVSFQCALPKKIGDFGFRSNATQFFWLFLFLFFCLSLFSPRFMKCFTRCCCKNSRDLRIDKLYNNLGLMISLLAVPFTKTIFRLFDYIDRMYTIRNSTHDETIRDKIVCLFIILPFFSYIFLKLFREMCVVSGKWDGDMKGWCCNQCCLGPIKLSKDRLERRLHYLTKRFNKRAPYWQFIIWGRQISILIFEYSVSNVWIMSILVIIVCALSLVLHIQVKPYKYKFQNKVEKWLLRVNIFIIIVGVIYSEVLKKLIEVDEENIWSWILTVIILIGMFGSLLIAIIYLQLWKKFFLSMKTMWRNEEIEEFDDGDDLAMSVNEGGYALLEEEELGEGGGGSAVKEGMEDEEIEEEGGNVLDENAMELTLLKQ